MDSTVERLKIRRCVDSVAIKLLSVTQTGALRIIIIWITTKDSFIYDYAIAQAILDSSAKKEECVTYTQTEAMQKHLAVFGGSRNWSFTAKDRV